VADLQSSQIEHALNQEGGGRNRHVTDLQSYQFEQMINSDFFDSADWIGELAKTQEKMR
jgi:hypothetical protein